MTQAFPSTGRQAHIMQFLYQVPFIVQTLSISLYMCLVPALLRIVPGKFCAKVFIMRGYPLDRLIHILYMDR